MFEKIKTPKRKSLIKFDSDLRSPKQNVFFNSARRDLSFKAIKNRGHRAQSKVHGLPVLAYYFCQNNPKSIQCPKILGHPTTKSQEKSNFSKIENIKAFEKIPSRVFHPSWRYAKPQRFSTLPQVPPNFEILKSLSP